jgi:hypothetical protein
VVITTFANPAAPGGVIAVSVVLLLTETLVAAVPPMVTLVAPVTKFVPVIVTLVPPVELPVDRVILLNVGAAT